MTFAVPPGERVFLRSSCKKDRKSTTPEEAKEDVKRDPEEELKTAITPANDQEMKDAEPEPEPEAMKPSKDEEMKDVIDLELQEIPASSSGAMETNVNMTSQEITTSSIPEVMEPSVNTEAQEIPTSSNGEETQIHEAEAHTRRAVPTEKKRRESPDFSVVIVSPRGVKSRSMKRTVPPPEPQPPVKRKRGRPRKHPLHVQLEPQPEHEPEREPEVRQEPELPQPDQPKPAPPVSSLSILAAEIEKNTRATAAPSSLSILAAEIETNKKAAAESSHPEPTNLDPTPTVSSPLSPSPPSPEPVQELSSIDTQNGTVEKPTDKPETPVIGEAPAKSPIEIDAVEFAPTEEVTKADNAGSNDPAEAPIKDEQDESTSTEKKDTAPSQYTTNEMDEIILSNITSPQALVLKILQIDGRMPNGRTANAWKELRCYRNNQDMGSLFDVRETWFLQHE